jgi:hypothetical protein
MMTPAMVPYGQAPAIRDNRQVVLDSTVYPGHARIKRRAKSR